MPAVSKAQQRFMGMVHAAQKGDMENPSPEVAKAADSISDKDAKDFASTKHKGLPNKVEQRLKEIIRETLRESFISEVLQCEACWKGYKQIGMKDKGGKQVPNCVPNESVSEAKGRGFATIQKDIAKVVDTIQSELEKYKSNKGTDKAKQNVENLKKLNIQKQRLEDELDGKVTSLYADYDLDQLHFMGRKK